MNFVSKAQHFLLSLGFILGAISLNALSAQAETPETSSKQFGELQVSQQIGTLEQDRQNQAASVAATDLSTEASVPPSIQSTAAATTAPASSSPFVLAQTAPAPQAEPIPSSPMPAQALPADPVPADGPAPATEPFLTQQIQRRFLYSYLGIGANLGLTGETPLSDTNFTVFSKILLSPSLSLRPTAIIGSDLEFMIPVTYDFSRAPLGEGIPRAVPFLGAGISIATGDSSEVDLQLTGGVDIPLSRQLTANATLNITPFNSFDVGVLLGLAYNFDSRLSVVRAAAVNPEFQRPRRPNPSYIGIGGNIGIIGDSALGNSSFAVLGKLSLTDYASIRPAVLLEDEATFLIPATYDFPLIRTEFISFSPYVGAGLSFSTGDDSEVDAVITGGIDIPITSGLAATAALNITPFDGFDWGAMVGIALTFGSF